MDINRYYYASRVEAQKSPSSIQKLSSLSKDDVQQHAVRKPLHREGKDPVLKPPRVTILSLHVSCNTNAEVLPWRNDTVWKMRRRLQKMLNLWPSIWRKAKVKTRNRLPGDVVCTSWKLILLTPVNSKSLRVTNKWSDLEEKYVDSRGLVISRQDKLEEIYAVISLSSWWRQT